ncbi:hypothetical protein B0J18DRAFT_306613 [Chaetomium sp. MPI-SDFR-AT-0129]|nr:hypothetical protein B0J18DRAFT_306613 [Chaetomium sp. MPI-SDFR-AT-0129]
MLQADVNAVIPSRQPSLAENGGGGETQSANGKPKKRVERLTSSKKLRSAPEPCGPTQYVTHRKTLFPPEPPDNVPRRTFEVLQFGSLGVANARDCSPHEGITRWAPKQRQSLLARPLRAPSSRQSLHLDPFQTEPKLPISSQNRKAKLLRWSWTASSFFEALLSPPVFPRRDSLDFWVRLGYLPIRFLGIGNNKTRHSLRSLSLCLLPPSVI